MILKIRGQLSNLYILFKIHLEMLRHLWTPFTYGIECLEVEELSWDPCPDLDVPGLL
jgi:hypothetical protein